MCPNISFQRFHEFMLITIASRLLNLHQESIVNVKIFIPLIYIVNVNSDEYFRFISF